MTERWLLVGATGRLGRAVLRRWHEVPPAAKVVPQARRPLAGHLHWVPLEAPAPEGPFDAVIVLAGAVAGPGLGETAALARACLEGAAGWKARRVLLASSSVVYEPGRDLVEDAPCLARSDYGRAKLEMEAVARAARVETCCLRIGNVAGADALLGQPPDRRITLDRFDDGDGPRRSYIGPDSLADVLAALLRHPEPLPEVLNVAAPRPVGMAELLRASGRDWCWRRAPETAIQDVTLDCGRLAGLVPLAEDLARPERLLVEAFREAGTSIRQGEEGRGSA